MPGKYWSIPYGDYPVTPNAPTGDWAHKAGAIPIANNVIPDPQLGRNRIGIMIHSGSAASLDELYTQGCFKVDPDDWPAVRSEILKEASNGPLYLHVQPGGVASFTNTKTLEQASMPTATTPGASPVQPSQPSYTFNLPNNAPMGMGNNNPLNIKYYSGAEKTYSGLLGPSSNTDQGDPQMKFATPEAGWNAAYSLLNKKYGSGMTTPNQIIAGQGGWTPGNKQAALNVAKAAGIGPDDDINFSDPAKAQVFMRALVMQEQGAAGKAYPDAMIASVIGAPPSGATTLNTIPPHILTPPTAGAPYTPEAVAAANPPPAAPAPPSFGDAARAGDVGGMLHAALTKPPPTTDAKGNTVEGKSPLQKLAGAVGDVAEKPAPTVAAVQQAAPAQDPDPGLAPAASQLFQTVSQAAARPLSWSSAPYGANAGLIRPGGTTLNATDYGGAYG